MSTPPLTSQQVRFAKSRAKVHCNLKDVDENSVKNIKCSSLSPCLFNLNEDPCEFDNKFGQEFDLRRQHMRDIFERYLREGKFEHSSDQSYAIESASTMDDGTVVGIILGGTIGACILVFIVVVCVKERCNQRRSVYHNKSETPSPTQNGTKAREESTTKTTSDNGISVITKF